MLKSFLAAAAVSALVSTAAFAGTSTSCGCVPTPPAKVKSNSGVGNGSEGGPTEANDRDPGRSGAHNNAGSNVGRPNSPNATRVMP